MCGWWNINANNFWTLFYKDITLGLEAKRKGNTYGNSVISR